MFKLINCISILCHPILNLKDSNPASAKLKFLILEGASHPNLPLLTHHRHRPKHNHNFFVLMNEINVVVAHKKTWTKTICEGGGEHEANKSVPIKNRVPNLPQFLYSRVATDLFGFDFDDDDDKNKRTIAHCSSGAWGLWCCGSLRKGWSVW